MLCGVLYAPITSTQTPSLIQKLERSTILSYLDFNSLYPTVMQEKLPYGNVRKLDKAEMHKRFCGRAWSVRQPRAILDT